MAIMRFDPFRDFDRLADQMAGGMRGVRTIPMEAYRRGRAPSFCRDVGFIRI
jgi:HSP20 family protein